MSRLQFKCTLLSDVVISESSATSGKHHSLDFIPGNNFLGIAAARLYDSTDSHTAYELFHGGKVRFGDAHPACRDIRTVRVPASMFYPKLGTLKDECYIHHEIKDFDELRDKQLKQCRSGFYAFAGGKGQQVKTDKNFFIKSAYDSVKMRSEDEKMFGYESIEKGASFYFDVDIDDSLADAGELERLVSEALCGERHVGRSRSAQYGLVRIETAAYREPASKQQQKDIVTVYADGRLVFFDENGLPSFRPKAEDLGIDDPDAEILWDKSQIRTFCYAPWNFKRQAFDNDRCGIEKGSVFVVRTTAKVADAGRVGSYQNEGFGKVVYNPEFLAVDGDNGQAVVKFADDYTAHSESTLKPGGQVVNAVLIRWMKDKRDGQEKEKDAYRIVEDFIAENEKLFHDSMTSVKWPSQWGTIRSIALAQRSDVSSEEMENAVRDYINHGVAKEQWEEHDRIGALLKFIVDQKDVNVKDVVINLASRMAKKLR